MRSRQVVAHLQKMLRKLESAAAAAMSVAQLGSSEREATIAALRRDVQHSEEEIVRVGSNSYDSMHAATAMYHLELDIIRNLMREEMDDAEAIRDEVEAARAQAEIDRKWKEGEEERRRLAEEAAQQAKLDHLQWVCLTKMSNLSLSFGWNTWRETHEARKQLKMRAIAAFRKHGIYAAMNTWKAEYPPRTLFSRVEELEKQLKRELENGISLKAALRTAERQIKATNDVQEQETQLRIAHLQGHALRRMRRLDLARAWSSWAEAYQHNKWIMSRAFARFANQALFAALRVWTEVYPPRMKERAATAPLKARIRELELELKQEQSSHEKLRKASARLFAERDYVRETAKQSKTLAALVEHQQRCLSEALQATSWRVCRQILYHESLRYVETAATHGKTIQRAHRRELMRRRSSGVLVDGYDVERLKQQGLERAESAENQEIVDNGFVEEAGALWGMNSSESDALRALLSGAGGSASGSPLSGRPATASPASSGIFLTTTREMLSGGGAELVRGGMSP